MDKLLTDDDLAALTGRGKSSWQKDRLAGAGPRFIKVGRLVRYRPSDVQAWLDARERPSTSQAA